MVIEKLVRITIFLAYLTLISRMPDLQRVFQYHGAEHKTISCYEAGEELTPENAQRYSRFHPRCGTSFLLLVMIVAIVVFAPLGKLDWHWLFISRIVGIPIVAGLAFELIKWFGKNRTKRWARILMWPGIQLQRLTTREPDLAQLAVAIAALQAVLAVENPLAASDEDKVGMEVVACQRPRVRPSSRAWPARPSSRSRTADRPLRNSPSPASTGSIESWSETSVRSASATAPTARSM